MDGAAAHVPKDKIGLQEGIDLIHSAGGLAVMAHPNSVKLDDSALEAELVRLKSLGLDGVECYYSQHTPERTETLLKIAEKAGLLPSGGSDFHGAAKPDVPLGIVHKGGPVQAAILDSLKFALLRRTTD